MLLSVTVDVLIMSMKKDKVLVEMLLVYVNLLIPETVGNIAAVSKQFMVTLLMVLIQAFVNVLNIWMSKMFMLMRTVFCNVNVMTISKILFMLPSTIMQKVTPVELIVVMMNTLIQINGGKNVFVMVVMKLILVKMTNVTYYVLVLMKISLMQ